MSDDSDVLFSDEDIDDKKHSKIVESVLTLNKAQNLKKPSRTEPALQISEFNLVNSITGLKGAVEINNLTKVLSAKKKHAAIGKKVDSTKKKTHTLPKPLEKPQSEKIRRTVGYEKNRFLFDRWEAFVTSNRAQAHLSFPLEKPEKLKVEDAVKFPSTWTYKSDLQKRIEKINSEVEEYHIDAEDEKDEFPLTLQELKEKRQEAAKLRAHQSYREAKARRQNKIKSKKYHRILRKERIKQKLKEFEELQKTDPEEALKKLEEIEKARALERFSLRHKGTGQWAKSKQVRAKYDKESRQVLAQQLQISRDLTQKQKHLESDSEDEGFVTEEPTNNLGDNPWVSGPKAGKEITEFVSGYKKFWGEESKKVREKQPNDKDVEEVLTESNRATDEVNQEEAVTAANIENNNGENTIKTMQNVKKKLKRKQPRENTSSVRLNSKKKKSNLNNSSGEWDIEDIFDKAEIKIEQNLKKKLLKNKKKSAKAKKLKGNKTGNKSKVNKKTDLNLPDQKKKQIIDEAMDEQPLGEEQNSQNTSTSINVLKSILDVGKSGPNQVKLSHDIDPEKFMKPKAVTNLDSALPDLMIENDNVEGDNQRNIIMEAFENNDIVDDFTKEKQDERDKDKPETIDLNLPGWGSWAGTGIDPSKQRKRRRFIVKMPEVLPRRDDNKGALIINEKATVKIKPHLVSEVPFPFKTVKDYEASIRAPISSSFVPETAHRKFIKPAVYTKMGTIIEPVTTSTLMGKPRR